MATGMLRMTEEQFEALQRKTNPQKPLPVAAAPASSPVLKVSTPQDRVLALGRLEQGKMNRTEAAYAAHLEMLKRAGVILSYAFEAVKLRLGKGSFYTPDFHVQLANGVIEFHEVKGHWRDDARTKIKNAAYLFPMYRFIAVRKAKKNEGGGWETEIFGG